jgi:VIT1/CCC1 family predicted Fe2+/Mn2+ transporter
MSRFRRHGEHHASERVGWLRAAILGADDGIVSTASLIVGVAAASAERGSILLTGVAGLVAGAMSMAAGEFVSVSSQSDSDKADLAQEKRELKAFPEQELAELTGIYVTRGLDPALARQVAEQLMAHDALEAHARDELGISERTAARPIQAAIASAASFSAGAAAPLLAVVFAPRELLLWIVPAVSILALAVLGGVGARAGGAEVWKPVVRVAFWGAAAMAVTAGIGRLAGAVV